MSNLSYLKVQKSIRNFFESSKTNYTVRDILDTKLKFWGVKLIELELKKLNIKIE